MDQFGHLMEKLRAPQPSIQRFCVTSIFEKLRSSSLYLNSDLSTGAPVISHCLSSSSPAVVDQSVQELCRLVMDSKIDIHCGLLELQSALEGANSQFVQLLIKAIGLVVCFGFKANHACFRFTSAGTHPFVKAVARGAEVHPELAQQVLLFIAKNMGIGIVEVCDFLRPFFSHVILKVSSSDPLSFQLARHLVASVASLCCSYPSDALLIYKLLLQALKYFSLKNTQDHTNFILLMEYVVDSYISILNQLVTSGSMLVNETQLFGSELLKAILCHSNLCMVSGCCNAAIELSKHLIVAQKSLSLPFMREFVYILLPLFVILIKSDLEHEQLSILRLLLIILKWKEERECEIKSDDGLNLELLLIFPVINLISSPSELLKGAATDLLAILRNLSLSLLMTRNKVLSLSFKFHGVGQLEFAISKLLPNLWCEDIFPSSRSFLQEFSILNISYSKAICRAQKAWVSHLKEILLGIAKRQKSCLLDSQLRELPILLGAIMCGLLLHHTMNVVGVDLLAAIGIMEPKLGVTLLLTLLFFLNLFSNKNIGRDDMLVEILNILPSLVSHSMMIPLVVQTIMPMLHKEAKPDLYAMGIRLLCRSWEVNDRVFEDLQIGLRMERLADFGSDRIVCISIAASICDVCRHNPDRGVDLILSVSACVESEDSTIQALGLQCLAYLCHADLLDFYTAWDVVAKHIKNYSSDPILARSVCLLLRWGAMDAEAYPEASNDVLHILWDICTIENLGPIASAKTRASAFEALSHFEVSFVEKCLPDFTKRIAQLFVCETNQTVLKAMEGFEINILIHEYNNRRREVRAKRIARKKIEKLLEVIPEVIFSSGKSAGESPGAALTCLSFTTANMTIPATSNEIRDTLSCYENALLEITASFQLSRNILVALLFLESWKPFMQRWLRARTMYLDAKEPSSVRDRTSIAADDILKYVMLTAEESIPRTAENLALAMGGLCAVLPPSAHTVKTSISRFLLHWLFQHEHEHRQWPSAISMGIVSCFLHASDLAQKFENIGGLIKVMCSSRSIFVKGCCGLALGYCCQDLLSGVDDGGKSNIDGETYKFREFVQLGKIIRILSQELFVFVQPSSCLLQIIDAHFPFDSSDEDANIELGTSIRISDDMEDDIWGVAGLIVGLGRSILASSRAGTLDIVLEVKKLIMSWFPCGEQPAVNSSSRKEINYGVLSVGSCLALPDIVALCQKMEIIADDEVEFVMNGYKKLISELVSIKTPHSLHQSLLMAASAGAGNFVAFTLNHGVHAVKTEDMKYLLESFRKIYSTPFPPFVHLGAMLGVVNALGANAGTLSPTRILPLASQNITTEGMQESPYIMSSLLSTPFLEPYLTSIVQEIFLISQNSGNQQLQQHAAWAISFLHYRVHYEGTSTADQSVMNDTAASKIISRGVPEDSLVMMFSSWLQKQSCMQSMSNTRTVVAVLRCLSHAPRLPEMEWGAIVRRLMRYGAQANESAVEKKALGKRCLEFSLAHAKSFDSLLLILDELSDMLRFPSLEFYLQSFLLSRLAGLTEIFSSSRIMKLFSDMSYYFSSIVENHDVNQNSLLRSACWKGIYKCLEIAVESGDYLPDMEKVMDTMFSLLPLQQSGEDHTASEWSKAMRCLGKARSSWLSNFLQVSEVILDPKDGKAVKKIQTAARLVAQGSLPLAFLEGVRSLILNASACEVVWHVLIDVVRALQNAEAKTKRQWLIGAVEISCVTRYPSTALQFVGILAGSLCRYMPLLLLTKDSVLSDLPLTLVSLLQEPGWEIIAETLVSRLLTSAERLQGWAMQRDLSNQQCIDRSEEDSVAFLIDVLQQTCFSLRDYLPLEKKILPANMEPPTFYSI